MRRDYPDRPFLGVGAVIIDDRRVLLVRRANPPLQGEWSIPGGLVETGETTRDAIRVLGGKIRPGSDVSEVCWPKVDELESLSVAAETCVVIRKAADGS